MDLDRHKENVISFYRMAFHGNPREAVERYVGKNIFSIIRWLKMGKKALSIILNACMQSSLKKYRVCAMRCRRGVSGATFITTLAGRRTICYHGLFPSKRIR